MKNKEWQKAESIFHTALELSGEERALYLSEACSDDDSLLFEVDSLICAFEKESGFLEETAFNLGMTVLDDNQEGSLTEQKIGCYQIKRRLGRGGMGDVYLAEDTRLNRKVALKFLKDTLLDDKWAKRQFIREAQAVALLEHPNICAVHNIEEIDEHNFIVMQYVEGATLDQFIGERKLNIEEILSIARQIVSAVTVAHSHSIIHRDIKPRNIMITSGAILLFNETDELKRIVSESKMTENLPNSEVGGGFQRIKIKGRDVDYQNYESLAEQVLEGVNFSKIKLKTGKASSLDDENQTGRKNKRKSNRRVVRFNSKNEEQIGFISELLSYHLLCSKYGSENIRWLSENSYRAKSVITGEAGKGYDIELTEKDKIRYIEVKGISSLSRGIKMTSNEIKKALEFPDKYDLLIVENPLDEKPSFKLWKFPFKFKSGESLLSNNKFRVFNDNYIIKFNWDE